MCIRLFFMRVGFVVVQAEILFLDQAEDVELGGRDAHLRQIIFGQFRPRVAQSEVVFRRAPLIGVPELILYAVRKGVISRGL